MSVFAEFPYVSIHWQPALSTVLVEWRGPAVAAGYRAAMDVGLRLLERRGAKGWVADRRKLGRLSADDREWYLHDWLSKAQRSGLDQLAVVPAAGEVQPVWMNPRGRRVQDVREIRLDGLRVGYFNEIGEALNWVAGARVMLARTSLTPLVSGTIANDAVPEPQERSA